MSGAGRIKRDASDSERLVEIKDANRVYQVSAADIKSLHHEASVQGKEAVFLIVFKNGFELEGIVRRSAKLK
ncbi:hypothetical protein UFOVP978_60 [uncultured Caudovirales phage]|uniref:Uncharacterized protein n=1 Tax=uncultured Caudovirales phage TaxID=2100421 RepID=A0A6J5Q5J7_9CAUD|nr:hypothetical protein UFOVP978_60 [uncultured Caudovirales phage]